ncbi:lipopolysaccharide transport periplasmic protein LptA [Luteimonas aquatica]|uniref:lipopolysaccharide transport periplasmic protein LptA n=1 Tax=Luteimonas aquatica TaxID=450364 RepID=UPI001F58FF75|nr:lipopolysaccharide transport periplasmic protein LptA [Luteimonas aquatica]
MTRSAASLLPAIVVALLLAGPAWAKSSDREQKMNVTASSSDCSTGDGPCILSGNVHIVQGTLDIQSAKADLRRADGDIKSVKLNGSPVKLKQQNDDGSWMNATAAQVDYDLPNDTVVFSGDAHVDQPGRGTMTGGRIVYNTKTGQVQSGSAAGDNKPVSMTFEPKKKSAPAASGKTPSPAPKQDGK